MGNYAYRSELVTDDNYHYPFDSSKQIAYLPISMQNENLKWETTDQYNVGLDLGFWNDRVNIVLDYYVKNTRDLLLQADLASSSGYASAMMNVGELQNRGFEFSIQTTNMQTKDFHWSSSFNVSFNKNEITKLNDDQIAMTPHNICEYARNQVLPFAEIEEPDIEDCPNLPSNFYPAPYEAEIIRLEQRVHFPTYPVINYTPDDWRRYLNAYYRLVETVDKEIGKILDALVELGLYDDAVIIFSSDHGDGVAANQWNQKSALFEEVVNVPFIVKAPGAFSSNADRPELVNAGLDLLPTICDYASAEAPSHATGKSIRELVERVEADEVHPFIVTETQFDKSPTRGWMVRTPRYKYVLYDKGKYREQLFDMHEDRKERRNLAVERAYRDVMNHHRSLLHEWIEQNNIVTTGREIIPPR